MNPNELEQLIKYLSDQMNRFSKKRTIEYINKGIFIGMVNAVLPKTSKIFATNLIKIIFSQKSIREKVIISHLFFENMIEEIIKENIARPKKILNYSFAVKLNILNSFKLISERNYICLKLINHLRNKYAHNLKYEILQFEIKKFPFLQKVKILNFKRKKEKEKYYEFLVSHCLWLTLLSLESEHKCISFMDY